MRETKVLVNELPQGCCDCPCYDMYEEYCNINYADCENLDIAKERHKNCPLQIIEEHDNEILEKARERAFVLYSTLYDVLEKQGNENIASMIDQLTKSNYGDLCDLYKTAKTIEIRDKATAFMATNEVIDEIRSDLRSGLKKFKPKPDDALTQFIYDLDNKLDKIDKKNREWSV